MIDCPLCGSKNPQYLGVGTMSNILRMVPDGPHSPGYVRKCLREGKIEGAEKIQDGEQLVWRAPLQSFLRFYAELKGTA